MPDYERVPLAQVYRAVQSEPLPTPLSSETQLPLGSLEPRVFERVALEFLRIHLGARRLHLYGRSGQKQYGLDIVGTDHDGRRIVCQVRRTESPTPTDIEDAVLEYLRGCKDATDGRPRFDADRYVLALAATVEDDTAKVDKIVELQRRYDSRLEIEVCGAESISPAFHDSPGLVSAIFGTAWSQVFCGRSTPAPPSESATWFGILEGPIAALGLAEANQQVVDLLEDDPSTAADLDEDLARLLSNAGYPGHASFHERRAAESLRNAGEHAGAFDRLLKQALDEHERGETNFQHELRVLTDVSDALSREHQATSKLVEIAFDWYGSGFPLKDVLELLGEVNELIGGHDRLRLTSILIDQAIVDEIFDVSQPIVGDEVDLETVDLAAFVELAEATVALDRSPTWRARLRCSVADAKYRLQHRTQTDSGPKDTFKLLVREAESGRWDDDLSSFILARAARAHLNAGDKFTSIELWRSAIRRAVSANLGGDVRYCLRSLSFAIESVLPYDLSTDPDTREAERALLARPDLVRLVSALPNRTCLFFSQSTSQISSLETVHLEKYRSAFSDSRRRILETRVRGHLVEELLAQHVFATVLRETGRLSGSVRVDVRANRAKSAAKTAAKVSEWIDLWADLQFGPAWVSGAAALAVKEQWHLVPENELDRIVDALLRLASRVWETQTVSQSVDRKAYTALCRLGNRLTGAKIDAVLELCSKGRNRAGPLASASAGLLARLLYEDPSNAIAAELFLEFGRDPRGSTVFWNSANAVGPIEPLLSEIQEAAQGGDVESCVLLAQWQKMTPQANYVARATAARLLATTVNVERNSWSIGDLRLKVSHLTAAVYLSDGVVTHRRPESSNVDDSNDDAWAMSASASELAQAVFMKYIELADDVTDAASHRDQAWRGVLVLARRLPPDLWTSELERLRDMALRMTLGPHDQFELASLDPLSGARFDTGARTLQALSICVVSELVMLASGSTEDKERLRKLAVDLYRQAEVHLQVGDNEVEEYAAGSISCLAGVLDRGYELLAFHRNDSVRKYATHAWVSSESAQSESFSHLLHDDSSDVRASCARIMRSGLLTPQDRIDLEDELHSDYSFIVRRRSTHRSPEDSI